MESGGRNMTTPSNKDVTRVVIGAAFDVHNELGSGFNEKVYENALVHELQQLRFGVQQQYPIPVYYKQQPVGNYVADLLVNKNVLCEIKAADKVSIQHEMQLVNYLAATGLDTGLLINFGRSVTVKRKFRVNPVNPD